MISFTDYSISKVGKTLKLPNDVSSIVLTYMNFQERLVFICSASGQDYDSTVEKYVNGNSLLNIDRHFEIKLMESFLFSPVIFPKGLSGLYLYKQLEGILITSIKSGLIDISEYILYNIPIENEKFLSVMRIKHLLKHSGTDKIRKIVADRFAKKRVGSYFLRK